MKKEILVTGVNGFVGHHVSAQLERDGFSVVGVGNQPELATELGGMVDKYISCDLANPIEVAGIDLSTVSAIINLAGYAKVHDPKATQETYDRVNIGVHTVLYDECIRQSVTPRIIAVSTGLVYSQEQDMPLTEESDVQDRDHPNIYVASKIRMEEALADYREKGLDIVIARPFNHTGPGQMPGFLIPDLGSQIRGALDRSENVKVGNLNTSRDYCDVRDVSRAYVLLATAEAGSLTQNVYNICSGSSTQGLEVLSQLKYSFDAASLKHEVDQSRLRDNDVMNVVGSYAPLHTDTGWDPEISFQKMIADYAEWQKQQ
jgi:GDP-4-dehydro-6-deoxy-D-mannose reductase